MVDHLRTRAEFEQCLRTNDDGETTAEFNGLNLRSVYQPYSAEMVLSLALRR
nr:hypothetical protein [Enterovibrio nigricans]